MSTAAVVATLSLAIGGVGAQDDDSIAEMGSPDPMASMEPGLYVRDAWARVSPMVDLAGAAYMVIHNNTDADDALIGVSSSAAEFVELHLSSMDDEGVMSMNQVEAIPVPAHGDAVLEPGSYHVMLINLVEPLTEDSEVELSLEFATAEPQTVSAVVMAEAPMVGDMDEDDDSDDTDDAGDMDDSDDMDDDSGEDADDGDSDDDSDE